MNLENQAREQLEESLKLNETLTDTPEGKADKIFSLLRLGTQSKFIFTTERYQENTKEAHEAFDQAEKYYRDAIELSKVNLGEHQLTTWCHKNLGDQFLTTSKKLDQAEEMYKFARNVLEKLGLDATERYVLLLKNLGICLSIANRANDAIEVLERPREIADELAESNEPNECTLKVYTSLADCFKRSDRVDEAVEVLEKACDNAEKLAEYNKPTVYKIKVYMSLADFLKQNDRTREAAGVLEKALTNAEKLAESNDKTVYKSKVYTLLALTYCSLQNYSAEAVRYARKALEIDEIEKNIKPYEHKKLLRKFCNF